MEFYWSENPLEDFYKDLASDRDDLMPHIPRSDVFYVKSAVEAAHGKTYSLKHIEEAMFLEGLLDPSQVFEPEKIRSDGRRDTECGEFPL